jgi:UDP-N-acetyl-2-amino-2-deoxyglucuronate dehydrogenase
MINHAIVGCGRIAENHVDAFSLLPDVHIKYAVDIVEEKAQELAAKFSIPQVSSDFDAILKDPMLDSISLAVPHHLHLPMALAAAKAGKHVLIEKPLMLFPDEGKELLETASAQGVVVLPVAQHRFDKLICEIKTLISSGEMGDLRFARGHLECSRPAEYYRESDWRGFIAKEGGSVLINQAYHILDLMLYFAGPITSAEGIMETFQKDIMETEDVLSASIRFQNRALGTLSVCGAGGSSWLSYIELIFKDGVVAFDINFPNQLHRFEMTSKKGMKHWRERLRNAVTDTDDMPAGMAYYGTSHREQAADFIAAIRKEKISSGATLTEALYVVEVINEIYNSAKSKQ